MMRAKETRSLFLLQEDKWRRQPFASREDVT
jgi:hypothetical protein